MAKVSVGKIQTNDPVIHRESSRTRLMARKIGLDIPRRRPSLPETEQEEPDIA